MTSKIHSVIKAEEVHNIVAEQNGWGQLENGTWINLKFTVPYGNNHKDIVEPIFVSGLSIVDEVAPILESQEEEKPTFSTTISEEAKVKANTVSTLVRPRLHRVKKGESLWDIAEMHLGKGERYLEIKELNKLTSDILRSGMVLKIPSD